MGDWLSKGDELKAAKLSVLKQFGFSSNIKIRKTKDFQQFFKRSHRLDDSAFRLYYRTNKFEFPRMGVITSKRNIRMATQRNRLKRIARDFFRLRQHDLDCMDIIIMAQKQSDRLDNNRLRECLEKLFAQLIARCKKCSSG